MCVARFVCLFAIVAPAAAIAAAPQVIQTGSSDAPPFVADAEIRAKAVSVEDGLSQAVVQAILQDRHGFMWFGTQDGLNRFDGYGFRIYKPEPFDTTSLSSGHIWDLREDSEGNLWVGTMNGLNRMDPASGRVTRYKHDPADTNSLSGNFTRAVYLDRSGTVWAGMQESGLNRLDPRTGEVRRFRYDSGDPHSLSHDRVFTIHEDDDGFYWIGTSNGVSRLPSIRRRIRHEPGLEKARHRLFLAARF